MTAAHGSSAEGSSAGSSAEGSARNRRASRIAAHDAPAGDGAPTLDRAVLDRAAPDSSAHGGPAADDLGAALALREDGGHLVGRVEAGWDVYGIPHGGYLAALVGAAALRHAGAPDLFTMTIHYNRKAAVGDLRFATTTTGGSRRFTSLTGTASQDGRTVLTYLASVGDRSGMEGPSWRAAEPWTPSPDGLTPPAGDPDLPFTAPEIAARMGMRLEAATAGWATGSPAGDGRLRATARIPAGVDGQLAALVLCDLTPPAVWSAVGASGWVPTLELTAHVRARPEPGTATIDARSTLMTDGFLEEDCVVHDAAGRLLVQSRQLARFSGT